MKNEIVFKTNDVCARLGISRRTWWYWTKKGKVHYTRIGQTLIFDRDEADRLGLLSDGIAVPVSPELETARRVMVDHDSGGVVGDVTDLSEDSDGGVSFSAEVTPEFHDVVKTIETDAKKGFGFSRGEAGKAGTPEFVADTRADDDLSDRVTEYMKRHFGGLK